MLLENKKALITGGSRGIGKAITTLYLKEGAQVMIASRSEEELQNAFLELNTNYPGRIFYHLVDVSKPNEVKDLVSQTISTLTSIDVLVNGAGVYGPIGLSHEVDLDHWKKTYEVNVFGTLYMFHEVVPQMIKQGEGKIINFSGGGDGPLPRFSAYNSSKAAIVRLTETLAEEVKAWGIEVNCLAPGPVNTHFLDEALKAGPKKVGEAKYTELLKQKREGGVPPEKAADLCLFLASAASDGLTGKFLSAVWDKYSSWSLEDVKKISQSETFTLRRIKWEK